MDGGAENEPSSHPVPRKSRTVLKIGRLRALLDAVQKFFAGYAKGRVMGASINAAWFAVQTLA